MKPVGYRETGPCLHQDDFLEEPCRGRDQLSGCLLLPFFKLINDYEGIFVVFTEIFYDRETDIIKYIPEIHLNNYDGGCKGGSVWKSLMQSIYI